MAKTSYLLGLGSNRYRHGGPDRAIARALEALADAGVSIDRVSRVRETQPLGPGIRRYANAAAHVVTERMPDELISLCWTIEYALGRRAGRRWGDRPIDIDLLLWSEGIWADESVVLPHPAFRQRSFVLDPLAEIAPDWRDPVSGLTIRQLHRRHYRKMPVDRNGLHA